MYIHAYVVLNDIIRIRSSRHMLPGRMASVTALAHVRKEENIPVCKDILIQWNTVYE